MELNNTHVFLPLLKHELIRRGRRNKGQLTKQWRLIYAISFVISIAVVATYFSMTYQIQLKYIWYVYWSIPFFIFGFGISKISREWNNETVGWWLTLPYPRHTLIMTKFWAVVIRGVLIASAVYVLILAFGAYATWISPKLSFTQFGAFAQFGLVLLLIDICAFPFTSSIGILYGTLKHTKWRPAIPLFWMIWGIGWGVIGPMGWIQQAFLPTLDIVIIIAIAWIVSCLLLLLAAWLLDQKIDL